MNERCTATRRDGSRCEGQALQDSSYCWAHHPELAEERRRVRRKGGENSASAVRASKYLPAHLVEIQTAMLELVGEVRAGKATARTAEAVSALAGRLLDFAKFADERGEQRQLEERLTALEATLAAQKPAGNGRR